MNIDEFLDLAKKRRSVRKFKADPIPDGIVEKVLDAAHWAQSGANAQPWEFIIVRDKETIHKMADTLLEYTRNTSWPIEQTRVKEIRHRNLVDGPPEGPSGWRDVPVIVVCCADPRTTQASVLIAQYLPHEGGTGAHSLKNMANATQIMHLAVAAAGLGSQWLSINYSIERKLKELLGVPDQLIIHTMVPIGYPATPPGPGVRRDIKEIMHYEKYDQSRARSAEDIYQYILSLRQKTQAAYRPASQTEK
ncbi:nitroreductase family protein [Chloroflexota bacterium]